MDSLRWPSSHELDFDEILTSESASAYPEKIKRIRAYIEKNWERLNLQRLSERNSLAKSAKAAGEWKDRGNEHFKNKRWKEAKSCYSQVSVFAEFLLYFAGNPLGTTFHRITCLWIC